MQNHVEPSNWFVAFSVQGDVKIIIKAIVFCSRNLKFAEIKK